MDSSELFDVISAASRNERIKYHLTLGQSRDHANPIGPKHIVGGENVAAGEFPFVAKIIYSGSRVEGHSAGDIDFRRS